MNYKRPCDGNGGFVSYSELTSAYVEIFEFDRWAAFLTMCPVIFSDTRPNVLVDSLADIVFLIRASSSRVDEQVPTGATFHHELAHLANLAIRDYYCKFSTGTNDYVCFQNHGLLCNPDPLNDVVSKPLKGDRYGSYNAQSYMYFSMAVWYYLKTQNEAQPLTYYFGWSDDDAVTGPKKRD